MGGRGASSGISDKGHLYGTDYKTVLQEGNIKFVVKNRNDAEELVETMTKGRVYVLVNDKEQLKTLVYFDTNNKKVKSVDIDHKHEGKQPHTHHGYEHGSKGTTGSNDKETKLIEKVKQIWYNRGNK